MSLWASGALNWCRLNSACEVLGHQSWHTISIYQKAQEPAKDKELVAFVENWLPCPSIDKIKGYTKVVVSFAVSYTWRPDKNQCDPTCTIGTPVPICNNLPQPDLVQQWKAEGLEVILSFGGAGMGGSWDGKNDCWEACFDRVDSVVSQLTSIVSTQGFDGVDIDYEYFLTAKSAAFLTDLTTKLKVALGLGKKVSHAPMDSDLDSGDMYFNVLKSVASSVDYLLPQYYNGFLRPVQDMLPVLNHYGDLVQEIFQGDETKVIFGFCISACPGFNVNSEQAVQILEALNQEFPDNGGAFLWAASHDVNRAWSGPVAEALGIE
mmetsp:Transcript_98034/g.179602  ORF Transcript_98034/g.179602 Transcript_98034/m.179602 type:complete len:321 (+) Transcript_98034:2-964(+)